MEGTKVFKSYNDWVNQSIQICKICGKNTFKPPNTCNQFYNHIQVHHGVTSAEYTVKYGSRWYKKIKHECRICQKSVILHHANFNIHTSTRHNMKSIDYFEKYVKDQPIQDCKDDMSSGESDVKIMPEKEAKDPGQFKEWINQCVQECKICSTTITSWDYDMMRHLSTVHKMTKKQYIVKYHTFYSLKVNHKCLLCGKNVWLQFWKMRSHMQRTHKMTPETYFKNHVIGNQPTDGIAGAMNPQGTLRKKLLPKQVSKPIPKFKIEYRIHKCKICQSAIPCGLATLKAHFQNRHSMILEEYFNAYLEDYSFKVNKWATRQIYPCQQCEQKFLSSQAFLGHMESAHSIRTVTQKEAKDLIVSQKNFHKCLVCGKQVMHKERPIRNHLKKFHDILNLNLYYQIFVKSVKRTKVTKPPVKDEFLNPKLDQRMLEPTPDPVDASIGNIENGRLAINVPIRPMTPPQKVFEDVQQAMNEQDDHESKEDVDLDQQSEDEYDLMIVEDIKPDPDDGSPNAEDWMNRCQFHCPLCEEEHSTILNFKSMTEFKQHASEDHSMTYLECLKSSGDPCLSPEFFYCKLCTKSTLHDEKMITNHLKDHSITPIEYKKLYLT